MPALALTDHDALYSTPRFDRAARQAGIKPIFGAEITLVNGGGHLTLLAENDTGYANLCWPDHAGPARSAEGLRGPAVAAAGESSRRPHRPVGLPAQRDRAGAAGWEPHKPRHAAERFASIFGRNNFFLEMQHHYERGDRRLNAGLAVLRTALEGADWSRPATPITSTPTTPRCTMCSPASAIAYR